MNQTWSWIDFRNSICSSRVCLLFSASMCASVSLSRSCNKHTNMFFFNFYTYVHSIMAAWLSGNALVLLNVVALHRARLVLRWVTELTDRSRVYHLGIWCMQAIQQPTGGLAAQVGWPGLRVGSRLALACIRQMNRVRTLAMTCSMYYYYYYEPQSRFARRLRTVHYELHDSSIVLKSFTMVRSLKYQTGDCQCLPALRRRQRTFADILAALRRLVATAL